MARICTYWKGTCSLCGAGEVTSKHYPLKHNIFQRAHFNAVNLRHKDSAAEVRVRCLYCLHCKTRVDGPHEAVVHLKEKHPELLAQQPPEVHDPEWALANATVGGVVEFLVDKRRKAEAEAACLRVSMSTLEEKLGDAQNRVDRLALTVEDLQAQNRRLSEESRRVLADNRTMNEQMLRMRNGARSAAAFRETYGEMQGKRG